MAMQRWRRATAEIPPGWWRAGENLAQRRIWIPLTSFPRREACCRRILRICKWGKFCCCCNLSWILIRYKFVSDKKNIFRSLIYISAIVRILAKYQPMSESLPSEKRIIMWKWWLKVQPVLDSFKLLFFSLVWLYCA